MGKRRGSNYFVPVSPHPENCADMSKGSRQENKPETISSMSVHRLSESSVGLGERSANTSHLPRQSLVDASPPSKPTPSSSAHAVSHLPVYPSAKPSRHSRTRSNTETRTSKQSQRDFDLQATVSSTPPFIPPRPNFDLPPYAAPLGSCFNGKEWALLEENMDDKVAVLLGVCRSLVTTINLPLSILQITGLGANIWDLGEDGVKEVTKSSWHVAYALLTGGGPGRNCWKSNF